MIISIFGLSPLITGVTLLLTGVGFLGVTTALLYLIPKIKQSEPQPEPPPFTLEVPSHSEAVLVVKKGGRLIYLNNEAKSLFGIAKGKPSLHHLIQRTEPADTFLSLCAIEGQAHFNVNGKIVIGKSHFVPFTEDDNSTGMLISLHKPKTQFLKHNNINDTEQQQPGAFSDEPDMTISIFTDISRSISNSLNYDDTVKAILNSIDQLLPQDHAELVILNPDKTTLTSYHLTGLPSTERKLIKETPCNIKERKFSSQILQTRKQLLIHNIPESTNTDNITNGSATFHSFLGLPLAVDTNLIGSIELRSMTQNHFDENDQELLRIIAHQAALALHNSKMYQKEKMRANELASLANLAQTVSALQEPEDLYSLLIDIISPLVDVKIIGFLIFDRDRRVLQGQVPFKGIQSNAIQWFQSAIKRNSPADKVINSGEIILTEDAQSDERIIDLGLHHISQAAGIFNTALVPLTSGGRMLGYLQIANKSDGTKINDNDLRILKIITGQAAPIIENSSLVQESRKRAQRADTLRRITKLANSTATINEILKFSLLDLARLMQADVLAVFVLDENNDTIHLHNDSSFGIAPNIQQHFKPLHIEAPDFINTITFSKKQFMEGDLFQNEKIPHFLKIFVEDMQIRSAIDMPLISRERGIGEIVIGSFRPNYFDKNALLTISTVAGQLASSIEKTQLSSQTDQSLQKRIDNLTELTFENARLLHASEQRSKQLQALTNISTTISASLQFDELIQMVLDLLRSVLPYDTGTLWLLDDNKTEAVETDSSGNLVVYSAYGFSDNEQRIGITVDIKDSKLFSEMISSTEPILVGNIKKDERFQFINNENILNSFDVEFDPEVLKPDNLTWLGIPLIASGKVIGVIALEKKEANAYSPDDIQLAKTFASQSAAALDNARLFQESTRKTRKLNRQSHNLNMLYRLSTQLNRSLDIDRILKFTTNELARMLKSASASAFIINNKSLQDTKNWTRESESYLKLVSDYFADDNLDNVHDFSISTKEIPFFRRIQETGGILNIENVDQEEELVPFHEFLNQHHTHGMLIIPISTYTSDSQTNGSQDLKKYFYGLLLVHRTNKDRFKPEDLELAKTISNQVAVAIQNAKLYAETKSLYEDLEIRVQQRTSELQREHHRTQTLLKIISELSASLDFEQVLNRTLVTLNEFVDAEQMTVLITRPEQRKLIRLASLGYTPKPEKGGSITPLNKDQGLAGWVIQNGSSALIDDVTKDKRWLKLPIPGKVSTVSQHKSAICVPLMSSTDTIGALMLYHRETAHFNKDQLELVEAVARQIGVAINNAELYRIIRDQAESMGSMLREQQIENSKTKAILESVADGILVTDASKTIILFNQSAENILGLDRKLFLNKPLENLSGIFGQSTVNWIQTINKWSNTPSSIIENEHLAEQITIENGNVISVHLAPVSLRGEFLGTVSVFQDITHQVEVDRLKSEFVATVSHELRTPMTSIKGYVEILLMGAAGELTPQQRQFVEVVKMNTDRLNVLVNDLLDVSKIEAGKVVLSFQPLNLEDLIDDAIVSLKQLAKDENSKIQIHKDIEPHLARVIGDKNRVRQIIDNLLDNAYQYSLDDKKITVKIRHVDNEVQIEIIDNGIGIQPEDQSHVFERFYRGENSLTIGVSGTGLGLPIVKKLIKMHNGKIWLESEGIPGKGSKFIFTLPIYKNDH